MAFDYIEKINSYFSFDFATIVLYAYGVSEYIALLFEKNGRKKMADYLQMWKDLGMDIETHDQLCEVLPQAFGDVFL